MSAVKYKRSRVLAFLLAVITLLSVIPIAPVNAETLSDGKSTYVTIKLNETHHILETVGGTRLQGQSWTYTSDTGIQGPAYCINWGLKKPAENKKILITGKYTARLRQLVHLPTAIPREALRNLSPLTRLIILLSLTLPVKSTLQQHRRQYGLLSVSSESKEHNGTADVIHFSFPQTILQQ